MGLLYFGNLLMLRILQLASMLAPTCRWLQGVRIIGMSAHIARSVAIASATVVPSTGSGTGQAQAPGKLRHWDWLRPRGQAPPSAVGGTCMVQCSLYGCNIGSRRCLSLSKAPPLCAARSAATDAAWGLALGGGGGHVWCNAACMAAPSAVGGP